MHAYWIIPETLIRTCLNCANSPLIYALGEEYLPYQDIVADYHVYIFLPKIKRTIYVQNILPIFLMSGRHFIGMLRATGKQSSTGNCSTSCFGDYRYIIRVKIDQENVEGA